MNRFEHPMNVVPAEDGPSKISLPQYEQIISKVDAIEKSFAVYRQKFTLLERLVEQHIRLVTERLRISN